MVGVGTANPKYTLDVNGSTNISGSVTVSGNITTTSINGKPAANYATLAANTFTGVQSLPANGLAVGTNQLATSAGNVGIGTANPAALLDIEGTTPTFNGGTQAPSASAALNVVAGNGASVPLGEDAGSGGGFSLTSGNGGSSPDADAGGGGFFTITLGSGGVGYGTAGPGGSFNLEAGNGGAGYYYGGAGGTVSIIAGAGGGSTSQYGFDNFDFDGGNGGNIILQPGFGASGYASNGRNGQVWIAANGGNVGIGTSSPDNMLSVNGSADKPGGGSWGTFSDARLKTVEGAFNAGLDAVMKLNPIVYRYKQDNALGIKDHDPHVGFVAQDVEMVIPEAVSKDAQGYRIVNNDPILWTMLNAIKEQQVLIRKQNEQNTADRAEIELLKQEHASEEAEMTELLRKVKRIQATLAMQDANHESPVQASSSSTVR
jgi:hypothetical protein